MISLYGLTGSSALAFQSLAFDRIVCMSGPFCLISFVVVYMMRAVASGFCIQVDIALKPLFNVAFCIY